MKGLIQHLSGNYL